MTDDLKYDIISFNQYWSFIIKLKGGQSMKTATNSGTNGNQTLTPRGIIAGYVAAHIFSKLTNSQIEYWEAHKTELSRKLDEVFGIIDEFADSRRNWAKFYKDEFGWTVDFNSVIIPPRPNKEGLWRLVFIAKGITPNKVFKAWRFKKVDYDVDLDNVLINKRNSGTHYAIWVSANENPDEKYLNESVEQADPVMEIGITLLERMVLGSYHFNVTGKHLDTGGATLCSGSRRSDGKVPFVALYPDNTVRVNWCDFDEVCTTGYGIREVFHL